MRACFSRKIKGDNGEFSGKKAFQNEARHILGAAGSGGGRIF